MRQKVLGISILVSVLFALLTIYIVNGEYQLAKFGFAFAIAFCTLDSLIYCCRGKGYVDTNSHKSPYPKKWLGAISGILLLVYMPMYTKGFFFHDDYINFKGVAGGNGFFEFTATQGRQATGILTDLMNYVTVENSWHLRLIAVGGVIVYILVLAQLLNELDFGKAKTAGLCLALGVITPVINVSAYGSMFCYPLAFVFSARGIICFWKAYKNHISLQNNWPLLLNGCLHIIMANYIYQATATVAFVVILLIIINDERKNSWFPTMATAGYIAATGVYYITVKLFSIMNPSGLMGRAGMISSVEEIIDKIKFFWIVLHENVKQLAVCFLGNTSVQSPWMHYLLYFKKNAVGNAAVMIFAVFILIGLYRILLNKGVWAAVQAVLTLPLSYYVFLLLAESSYTSYYSVALCSILLILSLCGAEQILVWMYPLVANDEKWRTLAGVCGCLSVCIMLFNGGYYLKNFWVDYNFYGFTVLKQEISQEYQGENRIHVVGDLYPGEVDVYAKSAAAIACKELNLPYQTIQFSSSRYMGYIDQLDLALYQQIISQLTIEEQEFFAACYDVNENFSMCSMRYEEMDDAKYALLSDIFAKSGIIPQTNDQDALVIDIRGIHTVLAN